MQTQGYERSAPWRQALALLDRVRRLTASFGDDAYGVAGKLRSLTADLPMRAALCHEADDYAAARRHAGELGPHLFKLVVHLQTAEHLGLVDARQARELCKAFDAFEASVNALPDELFEDDGHHVFDAGRAA